MQNRPARSSRRGFTLVELLVVIGIIALLVAMLLPTLSKARRQARGTVELSAVRQLATAFYHYANDHDGSVLPGYYAGAAYDELGDPVGFPMNARYPWRLMPWLGGMLRGGILVNEQDARLGERDRSDPAGWNYRVSVFPSFGMNMKYVGGDLVNGGSGHVAKLGQGDHPSELIVFASARYNAAGYQDGYFEVRPPAVETFVEADPAFKFGFVDPRHDGRAVAGFLDGHASMLGQDEVADERLWMTQLQHERHLATVTP